MQFFLTAGFGLLLSHSAFAGDITVASPVNGTNNSSSVWVRAHNIGCNGVPPSAFGYSIDNSGTVTWGVTAYDIDVTNQAIGAGTHTIHFKSWTSNGICPVVDTTVNAGGSGGPVSAPPPAASPSSNIDSSAAWQYEHDYGTSGSSRGSTVYPATTPLFDNAREFYMTYNSHGGERWHLAFGNNPDATHFTLDTYVYLANPDQVQNLELDLNQVMSNGQTILYGTQCSSVSHTWEFSTVSGNAPHWHASNVGCDPRSWSANTWHHVQIGFHRDSSGVVTHDWVNLDGAQHTFQNTASWGGLSLGWAHGVLLLNVQLDGYNAGSGSITAFMHKMTISSW